MTTMRISKHTYYLVESEYYKYWIIPDFSSGRKNRFTVVVVTASSFICIGRELPLAHSKKVIADDIACWSAVAR
jgi:hypothetical protein